MNKTRILINGYGRIGRLLHRLILVDKSSQFEVAAVNSRANAVSHANLLKYDSTYGILPEKITYGDDFLKINGAKIKVFVDKNPGEIDLKKESIDIVAECTGKFKDRESCEKQLKAGAKKVVISAPGKDEDVSIVLGVNTKDYNHQKHNIISNASCTTNCLAPVIKVLKEKFGVDFAHMTTIHAVTKSQNIIDGSHKKCPRRARCALESMIPTTTGAAKAIAKIFPDLEGKFNAVCVRVPFSTVSMVDLVVKLGVSASAKEINKEFCRAAKGELSDILAVTDDPVVSIDMRGNCNSAIVDSQLTSVVNGHFAKIFAWYDNEWGYTCRFYDLIKLVSK